MRILAKLIIFLLLPYFAMANSYTVLHVKGKIKIKSTGEYLKPRTKLAESEQVIFEDRQAMAILIHPKKGRQLLKVSSSQTNSTTELIGFVQNTLVAGTSRMSTRSGKLTNDLAFKNQFEVNSKDFYNGNYVFIEALNRFQVSQEHYPMDKQNFFFVRYQFEGESINKMLIFEGDQMIISDTELFKVDGQGIDRTKAKNFELYYRHSATSESRILCSFNPIFINATALKAEISTLLPFMEGMNQEEMTGEILGYMADAHGKVDEDQLIAFMKRHFPKQWK